MDEGGSHFKKDACAVDFQEWEDLMAFDIYPDANTSTILGKPLFSPLTLEPAEAMCVFVELAQHVGPDPTYGNVPTTFIRVAISSASNSSALQPTVELLAHDPTSAVGPTAQLIDPATANSIATAVQLFDGVNSTGAALAYFSPLAGNNVYLLKVAIEIPGSRLLSLGHERECGLMWLCLGCGGQRRGFEAALAARHKRKLSRIARPPLCWTPTSVRAPI